MGVKGIGRRQKTTTTRALDGSRARPWHHAQPEPPKGRPTAPKDLTGDAAAEWERMVARLEQSGALSVVDDAAIYQYACLFAEVEQIALTQAETAASVAILEENIGTIKAEAPTDLVALFQEITKLRQLEARYTSQLRSGRLALRAYLIEFGMTPSSRSRVKVPEKPKDQGDAFSALQQRRQIRAV